MGNAMERLRDEAGTKCLVQIPVDRASYLRAFTAETQSATPTLLEQQWTPVFDVFPHTKYDATEAFKSYAMGRHTACVFHLMRVVEHGLTSLGSVFGVSLSHTNWAVAIERVESKIREMHKDSTWKLRADCKDLQQFYSQCVSHVGIIKDAWRNYTAHAHGKYDEQEALDIMTGVRAFMQKLAERSSVGL
jgi:hypothetical protein